MKFRYRTPLLAAAWIFLGCVDTTNGTRDVRFGGKARPTEVLTQAELQQDVQRFTGQFIDDVVQAAEPLLDLPDPDAREAAMRRVLLYQSAAVDIATGPLPEVNVLDMLVFLALSRHALERHWNPHVFGERGTMLAAAFAESQRDIAPISNKLLTGEQQEELAELIEAWERAHPGQYRVENVRFLEFSVRAGRVSAEQAERAQGLLAQVKMATQAADEALLLGDRALFLAHRVPFLVRAHARLGLQETMTDTLRRAAELEGLLDHIPEARPLVQDVTHLTSSAAGATREARELLKEAQPLVDALVAKPRAAADEKDGASLHDSLATAERLADKTVLLLRELRAVAPDDPGHVVDAIDRRSDRVVRRWLAYVALLGAFLTVLFWSGYVAAKRLT